MEKGLACGDTMPRPLSPPRQNWSGSQDGFDPQWAARSTTCQPWAEPNFLTSVSHYQFKKLSKAGEEDQV